MEERQSEGSRGVIQRWREGNKTVIEDKKRRTHARERERKK